ncbi:MAG: alpha/beta hydrolase [Parachlamydia sp.]|nr:alpha/beta hydrolase [Parachlamydia sp.]
MTLTIKQVDYQYIVQNINAIIKLKTEAFLRNHKITRDAYEKTDKKHQPRFIDLLNASTQDSMEQIHRHEGLFFAAEADGKVVGISIGCPYGKSALSHSYVESVYKSDCCFKEVMSGWWNLMAKYAGTPPGKIFHQATMAIDPTYAGKGIGAKIAALTMQRIRELGYDGYAVETSSDSADQLADKLKKEFKVVDLDTNGKGLTFRLHLHPQGKFEEIHRWFLSKKEGGEKPQEVNVKEISPCGVHYQVGDLAVWDSNPESPLPVVVMLHPNSASRLVFKKQMEDKLLTHHFRLIAIDLPGHGDSKPATNPQETYNLEGYAEAIAQRIQKMGINRYALYGWSLGGHVALAMLRKAKGIRGIALTGTPPTAISTDGFKQVFKSIPDEMVKLMAKPCFSRSDAAAFMSAIGNEGWMVEYGLKADGRARQQLTEWIAKGQYDERKLISETQLPIAIIAGDRDPASPREYLEGLKFGNLWGIHYLENSGHGIPYEKPEEVNPLLQRFLKDVFQETHRSPL